MKVYSYAELTLFNGNLVFTQYPSRVGIKYVSETPSVVLGILSSMGWEIKAIPDYSLTKFVVMLQREEGAE